MAVFGRRSVPPRILGFVSFVLLLLVLLGTASAAQAAVSVTRAELSGGQLRVEGSGAQTGSLVRVVSDLSSASRNADSSGGFRVEASSFRSSSCRVTVSDPVSSTTATLSGCTATTPPPSTFVIDPRPLPDGNVGTDYNNFVTATGGTGTPYLWSIAAGALPAGLAIRDFASASGHIFGRPTTVQISTFTVRATDQAGNSTTRQFTITINAARPLVITSDLLTAGIVGQPYAIGVFADGGTTPYSWTQIAGALPPGLALQASPGRIQGTPTTAGTYSFTLRADDSAGQSATRAFSITVSAPAPPPSPPGTATLVSPAEGASVVTPFTISWTAVSDPVGITAYNWAVSTSSAFATTAAVGTAPGTATQATVNTLANGIYFWRVQAVNAAFGAGGWSATRSFTVTGTTNPSALTGVSVSPADLTGGTAATGTVFISPAAPVGGTTVGLTSGVPAVAAVPASVTVAAGQTTATFTVTTQPVTSSHTVVITAMLGATSTFAFLSVNPSAPPPPTDSVAIQRAEYDAGKRTLTVEATSTNASATMRVFNTATNVQIGTLANQGGGRYRSTFSNVATNPESITVRSSLGGAAARNVTLK